MAKLRDLLRELDYELITAKGDVIEDPALQSRLLDREIAAIVNDSRKLSKGCLFFCIEGANRDGHAFAAQAAESGAAAIVVRKTPDLTSLPAQQAQDPDNMPALVRVADTRRAMALIAAAYYGHPASEMKVIGVTGTKGKTTTTYMVKSILERAGLKVGLIGTIEIQYGDKRIPAANTTPESMVLQETFRAMADEGVQAVVMEVSSQALMLHRTDGILFDIGIFTNLSPDHIGPNEHTDFEDYLRCKSLLFRQCRVGIVNGDDPYKDRILEGSTCQVETYGLGEDNDLRARNVELVDTPGELGVRFDVEGLVNMKAHVPAPGAFSVYNALCAIAVCHHFDVPADKIAEALSGVHVKGRIEMVKVSDDFTLMIDYAHNAVALESLLTTLREYESGRLVCLFGCGGNRARSRRFEMGEVSGRLSDLTIITSDNPRFEEPLDIIEDIVTGISGTGGEYVRIPDRKEAIAYAIHNGQPGDIIVLAGKGHEDYQEIKGHKYPMDERVLIREILEEDSRAADGAKD